MKRENIGSHRSSFLMLAAIIAVACGGHSQRPGETALMPQIDEMAPKPEDLSITWTVDYGKDGETDFLICRKTKEQLRDATQRPPMGSLFQLQLWDRAGKSIA